MSANVPVNNQPAQEPVQQPQPAQEPQCDDYYDVHVGPYEYIYNSMSYAVGRMCQHCGHRERLE
jgi:hypothetical protein